MKLIILGILLMLISLWGGGYAVHVFPIGHWANFPAFMTAALLLITGVCCIVATAHNGTSHRPD